MKKEGEVEEGREWLLKDRNSTIVFRVLLLMIIEQCGIWKVPWTGSQLTCFLGLALQLWDAGQVTSSLWS